MCLVIVLIPKMTMEDTIMLDQLGTLAKIILISLCEHNRNDDDDNYEIDDSPFTVINNSCVDYYQSCDVKNMLIQDQNSLSLFCLNCHGL